MASLRAVQKPSAEKWVRTPFGDSPVPLRSPAPGRDFRLADRKSESQGTCKPVQAGPLGQPATETQQRSHDSPAKAWAKFLARIAERLPVVCPACGGDIQLISFIADPTPIRKILAHVGEPVEPPPVSPARGPPTEWLELVKAHDNPDVMQAAPDELPIVIHSR